jgi:undecaprenyl-diphosphatase
MTLLQGLVLGLVQGASEFLPISSSAHLVLVPWFLGWEFDPVPAFAFDVLVQWGTLAAVVVYFRAELWAIARAIVSGLRRRRPFEDPASRLGWLLLLASLPAAAVGAAFKSGIAATFDRPAAVSAFLLVTAALLAVGERVGARVRDIPALKWHDALWIGTAQILSLFPGISRSGSTIVGGLTRGLRREQAARFSFLMAVPIMFGAGLVALTDLASAQQASAYVPPLIVGLIAAAISGYAAIHWLLGYLARRPLTPFVVYCAALGGLGLLLNLARA